MGEQGAGRTLGPIAGLQIHRSGNACVASASSGARGSGIFAPGTSMAVHRGYETGWARIGGYPELPDSPLGLGRWLKPTIRGRRAKHTGSAAKGSVQEGLRHTHRIAFSRRRMPAPTTATGFSGSLGFFDPSATNIKKGLRRIEWVIFGLKTR
jgi:hypothetical protein